MEPMKNDTQLSDTQLSKHYWAPLSTLSPPKRACSRTCVKWYQRLECTSGSGKTTSQNNPTTKKGSGKTTSHNHSTTKNCSCAMRVMRQTNRLHCVLNMKTHIEQCDKTLQFPNKNMAVARQQATNSPTAAATITRCNFARRSPRKQCRRSQKHPKSIQANCLQV